MSKVVCRLCGKEFDESEMSNEHYPAKSVGNDDVVAFDIVKFFDLVMAENPITLKDALSDNEISKSLYPKGRTAKSLCIKCNNFLGKYDEDYYKFYSNDGNPQNIKGFQKKTKLNIIKAIYGKFLSIPEAKEESFDFIDFIRNESEDHYKGIWRLYFIKRNSATDIMGLANIDTGRCEFDEGVVYELSDDKFIFQLMNFDNHKQFPKTNIFDILNKSYKVVEGINDYDYHAQILLSKTFDKFD